MFAEKSTAIPANPDRESFVFADGSRSKRLVSPGVRKRVFRQRAPSRASETLSFELVHETESACFPRASSRDTVSSVLLSANVKSDLRSRENFPVSIEAPDGKVYFPVFDASRSVHFERSTGASPRFSISMNSFSFSSPDGSARISERTMLLCSARSFDAPQRSKSPPSREVALGISVWPALAGPPAAAR